MSFCYQCRSRMQEIDIMGIRKTVPEWCISLPWWTPRAFLFLYENVLLCSFIKGGAIVFHHNRNIVFLNEAPVESIINGLFIRHIWFYVFASKVFLCNSPWILFTLLSPVMLISRISLPNEVLWIKIMKSQANKVIYFLN